MHSTTGFDEGTGPHFAVTLEGRLFCSVVCECLRGVSIIGERKERRLFAVVDLGREEGEGEE